MPTFRELGKPEEEPDEDAARKAWQLANFARLGFDPLTSALLVETGHDWHEARRLLERGCPHELALAIIV